MSSKAHKIDEACLLRTQIVCGAFATVMTAFTLVLLLLIFTLPVARSERIGYAIATGVGAVFLWCVFYNIHRSRHPKT